MTWPAGMGRVGGQRAATVGHGVRPIACPVGQPCGADENCAAPLTCGLGAVCDISGQIAAFCDQDADCMTGLVCNTGYTPDECHPPGVAGARCGGRPEECEVGLTCDATVVPYVCR